jgi:hypothetical protein
MVKGGLDLGVFRGLFFGEEVFDGLHLVWNEKVI